MGINPNHSDNHKPYSQCHGKFVCTAKNITDNKSFVRRNGPMFQQTLVVHLYMFKTVHPILSVFLFLKINTLTRLVF